MAGRGRTEFIGRSLDDFGGHRFVPKLSGESEVSFISVAYKGGPTNRVCYNLFRGSDRLLLRPPRSTRSVQAN